MADLVTQINLSKSNYTRLGGVLSEMCQQYEDDHARMLYDYRVFQKWYEAEPATKTRSFPFEGASNIVVPLIRTAVDSTTARLFAMVQSKRRNLWIGHSENEEFAETYLHDIIKFLNWAARREFDTFWCILDWITECCTLGSSVLSMSWEEHDRYLLLPGNNKPKRVTIQRGPKLRHHPAETILWDPGVPIRESEVVFVRSLLSWSELVRNAQLNGYRQEAVEATRSHSINNGSPSLEMTFDRDRLAGIDPTGRLSHRALYDRRVAWLDWPVLQAIRGDTGIDPDSLTITNPEDGEKIRVPIIVEFNPLSQQIYKVFPNPYLTSDGNPFFDIHFTRRAGYSRGIGLAKKLDQLQVGMTVGVNQAFDAVTLANSTPLKTTNAALRQRPIAPNQIVLVTEINDLVPVGTPKSILPDIAIINLLQVMAERTGGASDPLVGRESRSGGHPSPATNYLGMMEQSTTMVAPVVKMMREQLSAIGERAATLYQQFDTDPEGRLVRNFGAGGRRLETFLFPRNDSIPGNIDFDVTAMSETENPQSQIQQALLTSQVTQNYFATLFKALEIFKNPQMGNDPDVRRLVTQTIETLGRTHQNFLEAAEFDEAQEAIFKLQEQGNQNAAALQQFAALLSRVGGAGGGQATEPPGGPGGPSPRGAGPTEQPPVPAMESPGGGNGGDGSFSFS